MRTPAAVLEAYGIWIAGLAPWTHFVTLTHRLPDSSDANRARNYTRVGLARHRRLVRKWFHGDVRPRDPAARWWSELELHESGIPHEHGLLALGDTAPALRFVVACRQARLRKPAAREQMRERIGRCGPGLCTPFAYRDGMQSPCKKTARQRFTRLAKRVQPRAARHQQLLLRRFAI